MDQRIAEFIREHRTRLTREAITRQLEDAGYGREAIDRTWDRLAAEEPIPAADDGRSLGCYVWIVYALGGAAVAVFAVVMNLTASIFGIGWLVAYLVLAGLAAWFLASRRTSSVSGSVAIVIIAPIVFVLIGGGICAATLLVVFSSLGY